MESYRYEFGFLLVFACANLICPVFVDEFVLGTRGDRAEYFLCVVFGMVLCELATVSAWLAMTPGTLVVRVAKASAALVFLAFVMLLGFLVVDEFPIEVVFVTIGSAFVGTVIFVLPLACYSAQSGRSIRNHFYEYDDSVEPYQFSVRQLLVLTTFVALMVAIGKVVFPMAADGGLPWGEVIPFCIFYLLLCGGLIVLNLLVVFDHKWRPIALICVAVCIGLMPLAALVFMRILFPSIQYEMRDVFPKVVLFLVSFCAATDVCFLVGRGLGFHLHSSADPGG